MAGAGLSRWAGGLSCSGEALLRSRVGLSRSARGLSHLASFFQLRDASCRSPVSVTVGPHPFLMALTIFLFNL